MYKEEYRSKEEMEIFWDMFLGCPEDTEPQHLPEHLWAKGKSAAPKQPGAILWTKRGQWWAGTLGRKREP